MPGSKNPPTRSERGSRRSSENTPRLARYGQPNPPCPSTAAFTALIVAVHSARSAVVSACVSPMSAAQCASSSVGRPSTAPGGDPNGCGREGGAPRGGAGFAGVTL